MLYLRQAVLVAAIVAVAVGASLAGYHLVPADLLAALTGEIDVLPRLVDGKTLPPPPMVWQYWRVWVPAAFLGLVVVRLLRGRPPELARTTLFGLVVALAVVFGFVSYRAAPGAAVTLVQRFGYFQILAVSLLFGFCCVRSLREDARATVSRWRAWLAPAAVVVGAAGFLHVHESHEYKIVMDEVVLQSTAMRMHFERQVSVIVRGYDLAGNMTAFAGYSDKRPLFFPFLVSVLHDLTGYRTTNPFVLNGLLTLALTGLTFLAGRRLAGVAGGVGAVLLLVSIPLVHQNATGGGFETLNMVMILATLWLGMRYAERPEDTDRLGAFLFSGVLLAQTRYESALFVLPVAATILFVWWRRRAADLAWPVLLAPLMVVIIPLHFNVFKISTASWQLNDIAGAQAPFGLGYFYDNIGHTLSFLFSTDGVQPNSVLVSILGIVGVAFLILVLYRQHREIFGRQPAIAVFCIFVFGLFAHTALMHLYFWGRFDDPVIRRLSLPMHLLLILSFVFILPQLVPHRRRWGFLALASVLFTAGVTVPTVAMHRYNQENFAARWNNWIADYLRRMGPQSSLAIDRHSWIQWPQFGQSGITVDALAANPEKYLFQFRNRSFQNYYIVQIMGADFDKGTRFPTIEDDVGEGLKLETVAEVSMNPIYHMRLSRVVGVDLEKLLEWRKKRLGAVQITPETKANIDKANSDELRRWFDNLP